MDVWIFTRNSQMANNIVKWWKTKVLNGYKQFSVECRDGKVSDTEELLGRIGSNNDSGERFRPTCTTPPMYLQEQRSSTPIPTEDSSTATPKKQPSPQPHLNFEGFSCDVSVKNGEHKCGQERQEFSFTLYDFDGHGKITKDDISSLVSTIYEALGSSVKVPHYGSKTIKVKLTVSPEQRKQVSATIINQKENQSEEKPEEPDIRYKKDLNVTIEQGPNEKRRQCWKQAKHKTHKKRQCCNRTEEVQEQDDCLFVSDDSSDVSSRISGNCSSDQEEEGECSEDEKTNKPKRSTKGQKNHWPRYTIPNMFVKDSNVCNENNCSRARNFKKRSGSLQRQELLEIIQANMNKNNLSFQTPRKHSSHISTENKQLTEIQHKHHNKVHKVPTSPLQYLANIVDPTHFYVDLASLQNTTQLPQTHYQYDKLIDAVMCVSNKKISLNKQSKCRKQRSKADCANNSFRYQFLQYPMTNNENKMNKTNKRTPKKSVNCEVKSAQREPEGVAGPTPSPHHLRHRNRQEDQARAMAQVVRWLEQEFSNNFNTKEKEKIKTNHCHSNHKEKNTSTPPPPNLNSGVERHEHHHVHEHIHHHYHHYQETPLVV